MSRRVFKGSFGIVCIVFAAVMSIAGQSRAELMSYDDAWDVSQGTTVTSNSAVHPNSVIENMFGNTGGYSEQTCAIFTDSEATGYVHWVEWQTASVIELAAFNLVAAHDTGSGRDANERGFSRFSLYAWVGGDWQTLYNYYPSNPYGGGENYTDINFVELYVELTESVTAQKFRAEFVQYGDRTAASHGPRILELDGYAIPEPATLSLLSLGTLAILRRRRA